MGGSGTWSAAMVEFMGETDTCPCCFCHGSAAGQRDAYREYILVFSVLQVVLPGFQEVIIILSVQFQQNFLVLLRFLTRFSIVSYFWQTNFVLSLHNVGQYLIYKRSYHTQPYVAYFLKIKLYKQKSEHIKKCICYFISFCI